MVDEYNDSDPDPDFKEDQPSEGEPSTESEDDDLLDAEKESTTGLSGPEFRIYMQLTTERLDAEYDRDSVK